jgi:hypothetical protein
VRRPRRPAGGERRAASGEMLARSGTASACLTLRNCNV